MRARSSATQRRHGARRPGTSVKRSRSAEAPAQPCKKPHAARRVSKRPQTRLRQPDTHGLVCRGEQRRVIHQPGRKPRDSLDVERPFCNGEATNTAGRSRQRPDFPRRARWNYSWWCRRRPEAGVRRMGSGRAPPSGSSVRWRNCQDARLKAFEGSGRKDDPVVVGCMS